MAVKSAAGAGRPASGSIRAGMGGWTFEPWDKSFYPEKLGKAKQLNYASRQVPTIEVNGTYYSTFKPADLRQMGGRRAGRLRVLASRAIRFVTNRRVLAEAGESRASASCAPESSELGDKLGPLLWQFAPTKKFDADDFDGLPQAPAGTPCGGVTLRHAVEVRHRILRRAGIRDAWAQARRRDRLCRSPDLSGDRRRHRRFRLCTPADRPDDVETCYAPKALDGWADARPHLGRRQVPDDLPRADPGQEAGGKPRDVFVYFIHRARSGRRMAPWR